MCLPQKIIVPDLTLRIWNIKTSILNQPVRFITKTFNTGTNQNEIRIINDVNGHLSAYFLPWKEETGLYIDLPCNSPMTNLFLTPSLTGCLIGIKEINIGENSFIRICHWNSDKFEMADLQRYEHWILPQKMKQYASNDNMIYYGNHPSAFYGEYYDNKWHFTLWQADHDVNE